MTVEENVTQSVEAGISKSFALSIRVFVILTAMLSAALITGALFDDASASDVFMLFIPILGAAGILALIVFFIGKKFIWTSSQRYPTGKPLFDRKGVVMVAAACLFGIYTAYTGTEERLKEKARIAALTPEQRLAEAEAKHMKDQAETEAKAAKERNHKVEIKRIRFAKIVAEALRNSLRDPQSLTIEYLGVNKESSIACIEYRAKNGFGGMNRTYAVLKNEKFLFQNADAWNKNCANVSLYEMTSIVD